MKRINLLLSLVLLVLVCPLAEAQNYWVFLTDKEGVEFNPYEYFDQKAIERRLQHGLPLNDITDYPVNSNYIDIIQRIADSTGYVSRWFNAVAVVASRERIAAIEALPFVRRIEPSFTDGDFVLAEAKGSKYDTSLTPYKRELIDAQTAIMGRAYFEEEGYDGKGIRIAIFDGGFPSWQHNPTFAHIRDDGRIIATYDFTKGKENVDRGVAHGTMVMSCIGGMIDGQPIGCATGAEYMMAITEIRREPFKEEQNWLAAMEWADKGGADIINSSLGYTADRYFNYQMDGRHTFVTRAANMAAAKGLLVVNAAGNEGFGVWHIVGAPADADSVLSIGGIHPKTGFHTSFSSYGPTADKRLKPNVVAFGHVVAAGKKKLSVTQGTSFASPLVAGFAACAWQTNPNLTNMQLFKEIEKSGHLYPYFDYAHGYGVPQADYFTKSGTNPTDTTFDIQINDGHFSIIVRDQYVPDNDTSEQIKDLMNSYLYLHIRDREDIIKTYRIIKVKENNVFDSAIKKFHNDEQSPLVLPKEKICAHYRGYTITIEMP